MPYSRDGGKETVFYTIAATSLGTMLVARSERGLCALWWGDGESVMAELRHRFPQARLVRDDAALAQTVAGIEAYLSQGRPLPEEALDARGSEFQRRVWSELRKIPAGETRTYAQIAQAIGKPSAARAVARACATNPVALFIPCHRVIRSDGDMAGFRWGVGRKKALLALESQ